ncbi:MAG: dihydrolipoamide acetyltransferase family protein [Panacagrimonas sp.]
MAEYLFKLPDIGEGIAESEIASWRVAVGEMVTEDQPLVDMLTDKAAVEIPSPLSGKILRLHGAVGDKIAVGAVLVTIEITDALKCPDSGEGVRESALSSSAASSAPTSRASVSTDPHPAPVADGAPEAPAGVVINEHVAAAPTVRKRARELGMDLRTVRGTGPGGRIVYADLESANASVLSTAAPAARAPVAPASDDDEAVETLKIIGLRRKIAEAMQKATQRIPHFAYVEEIDMTELEALRVHLNRQYPDRPKLTLLPLLIQALVRAVPAFPMVNATFDDEAGVVTRHRALHVGIATQTANGLMVPVLRHAQRLDLWQRAARIKQLADSARAGKGTREELSGSTLTITSLGALGGIATTPIINAPEVAIIGVNKMVERAVVKNGQMVVRTMMNLSSSFDHRIVDGFDAASFIQNVKTLLEHPATLFMEMPSAR